MSGALTRRSRCHLIVGLVLVLFAAACSDGSADDITTAPAPTISSTATSPTTPATTTPSAACTTIESPPADPSDWASYGFDDDNSRYNGAETRIGPDNVLCLEVLWSIEMPGLFGDEISVANGMLFVGYGFSPGGTAVRDSGVVAFSLP